MHPKISFLCLVVAGLLSGCLSGCGTFRSTQTETAPDGTVRTTKLFARTFFDSSSSLAKLRATTTDKTQGMTIGSLTQDSSGTNAVSLMKEVVGAAVEAAIRSSLPH